MLKTVLNGTLGMCAIVVPTLAYATKLQAPLDGVFKNCHLQSEVGTPQKCRLDIWNTQEGFDILNVEVGATDGVRLSKVRHYATHDRDRPPTNATTIEIEYSLTALGGQRIWVSALVLDRPDFRLSRTFTLEINKEEVIRNYRVIEREGKPPLRVDLKDER